MRQIRTEQNELRFGKHPFCVSQQHPIRLLEQRCIHALLMGLLVPDVVDSDKNANDIWLFIPLGTGLYRGIQKKWVLLIPFVMSVAIETAQYITGLGIAEFNDVFGNTMGGWIGVLTAWAWLNRKMSLKNRT